MESEISEETSFEKASLPADLSADARVRVVVPPPSGTTVLDPEAASRMNGQGRMPDQTEASITGHTAALTTRTPNWYFNEYRKL